MERWIHEYAWLREIAAALCDESSADDVAQDALIRVADTGIPAGADPRGWLHAVVRNLAIDRHRGEQRRRRRERARAQPEATPRVSDALERAELAAILAAEVQALPVELRTPLVLRYLEGHSLAAVARALQIAPEAARKRIYRARVRLRERLAVRLGPDWRIGCALLACAPTQPIAAASVTTGIAMSMQKKLVVAAAFALVALVGWFLWPAARGEDLAEDRAPPLAAAPLVAPEHTAEEPRGRPLARREAESEPFVAPFLHLAIPPRRFGFTGRVVRDPDGSPVPHALVRVSAPGTIVECDEHGRFTWLARQDRNRQVTFTALVDGFVGGSVAARPTAPAAEVVVPVHAGAPVLVRVVDERTRVPVAGAWVTLEGERSIARTGADGLATLCALPADREVVMSIETIGGTVWGRRFERRVRPGSGEVHELAVEVYPRRATLRAVHAGSRLPLVGARYRRVIVPAGPRALDAVVAGDAVPESAWETVDLEPAADRTVTVELPASEAAIIVLAEADGHLASRCVVVADGGPVHEIRLWPIVGVPIELFAAGRPLLGGATITMDSVAVLQQSPPGPRSVRPGTGPRLQFGNVANSRAVVAADDRGHATLPLPEVGVPETIRLRVVASDGRSRDFGELLRRDLPDPPWQLDIAPGRATVTVRVVDHEGTPLAGVPVELSGSSWPEHAAVHESMVRRATHLTARFVEIGLRDVGRTDGAGVVALSVLDGLRMIANAEWQGVEARVTVPADAAQRDGITLRTGSPTGQSKEQSVTGRLVPRSGRLPEAPWRARIEARRLDDAGAPSGRPLHGTIGRDGAFRIGVPEAGRYEVRLPWSSGEERIIASAGDSGLLLTMPAVRTFEVRVIDADSSEPVHGETWLLGGADGAAVAVDSRNAGLAIFEHLAADVTAVGVEAVGYRATKIRVEPDATHVTVRVPRER